MHIDKFPLTFDGPRFPYERRETGSRRGSASKAMCQEYGFAAIVSLLRVHHTRHTVIDAYAAYDAVRTRRVVHV